MPRPPKKEKLSSLFLQGLRFKIFLLRFRSAVRTAEPQPWAPDHTGHCRASTESSRSQRALPDLNHELQSQRALPDLNGELQITVGVAGPLPRAPDLSEHCRTSTTNPNLSGHCRTSTANSRSQWASPDLNRELQISAGTAGPQRRTPDHWALPDLPDLTRELHISVGPAGPPQPRAPDLSGHCPCDHVRENV